MFHWRIVLPSADKIIKRVAADIMPSASKHFRPPRKGLDLSDKRESLAVLLALVFDEYEIALGYYEERTGPNKPSRSQKFDPVDPEEHAAWVSKWGEPDFFCGYATWEECWDHEYKWRRGNPGTNRSGGPPIFPLHGVYPMVRDWWQENELGKFHPTFDGYDETEFNPDSRLWLGVIKFLNPEYSVVNARGLYGTMRKKNKTTKK